MDFTQIAVEIPDFLRELFRLDPQEPFKLAAKLIAMSGAIFGILTTLATKTLPWLRVKWESRAISKRLGPEFPVSNVERSLRYYIPPMCQDLDPAGGDEPRLVYGVQQKLFEALDRLLTHPTEYHFVILLADSGMGKTSALLNYYVRHLRSWRRRRRFNLALVPLGVPDADERIASIKDRRETVLFLDALDEDTLAIVDYVERLRLLLKATRDFQRVLISCRTQFFSKDEEIPKETGKIKVIDRAAGERAEYYFHKIYLSPFSDGQVAYYLKRRYPIWKFPSRRRARAMVAKIPHLTARPMLLAHVDDLVRSKREITYSFELYEEMVEAWFTREEGFIRNKEDLRQFSERLAVDIYLNRARRGSERVQKAEMLLLAREWSIPLDDWKLSGRSLLNRDAEGNFKFAHRSIMEYLFVKRFTEGDESCLGAEWTDQMCTFFWEMLEQHHQRTVPLIQALTSVERVNKGDAVHLNFLKILVATGTRRLERGRGIKRNQTVLPFLSLIRGIIDTEKSDAQISIHLNERPESEYDPQYISALFRNAQRDSMANIVPPDRDQTFRNEMLTKYVIFPIRNGDHHLGALSFQFPKGSSPDLYDLLCILLGVSEERHLLVQLTSVAPLSEAALLACWRSDFHVDSPTVNYLRLLYHMIGVDKTLFFELNPHLVANTDVAFASLFDSAIYERSVGDGGRVRNFLKKADSCREANGHPVVGVEHMLYVLFVTSIHVREFLMRARIMHEDIAPLLRRISYTQEADGSYERIIQQSEVNNSENFLGW